MCFNPTDIHGPNPHLFLQRLKCLCENSLDSWMRAQVQRDAGSQQWNCC